MTETEDAPAAPAPPPPRRGHTFLGRLAAAVREQNWFAVVLEVLIVIVGVVIGFQVTAWGQARADRAREAEYLRQLRADLDRTEQIFDEAESSTRKGDRAAAALLLPFRTDERPPPDSIYTWLQSATLIDRPKPVTGTAEALVATGDLNLIRDDSLRAAITDYLALWELINAYMEGNAAIAIPYGIELGRRVDAGEALAVELVPARDSLEAAGWAFPFPEGPSASPFPLDVDAFYADRELYFGLMALYQGRRALRYNREAFRRGLATIREQMDRAAPRETAP